MPSTEPDPAAALGRDVERLARHSAAIDQRIGDLEGLLQQLATDVATLAARSGPDGDEGVRAWLLTDDPKRHCCVHRWGARAGCADASSSLWAASAEVKLRGVSVPAGGDHRGCAVVLALWALIP
jgi:hypothetical protein